VAFELACDSSSLTNTLAMQSIQSGITGRTSSRPGATSAPHEAVPTQVSSAVIAVPRATLGNNTVGRRAATELATTKAGHRRSKSIRQTVPEKGARCERVNVRGTV
jgi:hypothetical protein